MSKKPTWTVALGVSLLLLAAACGGEAQPEYPAGAPAEPAAEEAPAYGPQQYQQPSYAQPPPGPPDGVAPQPPPAERQLETVEDASSALDQDELILEQLLQQPIPAAQAGLHACRRVCAALGSMARSVDAICELTGQDDARCGRARQRLDTNTRRVEGAGCAC